MEKIRVSAIAAIGKNRELGKNGDLIWKFEADFELMKSLIKGHTLIMGRKTYESIGLEMPYSPSVVVTSDNNYKSPYKKTKHTFIVSSLDKAFRKSREIENQNESIEKEIFIFGGGSIYAAALPKTDRLYLTVIKRDDTEADTFFPDYSEFKTVLEKKDCEENGIRFDLITLER